MNEPSSFVVAVAASYQRAKEMHRCLETLRDCGAGLGSVYLVDNGGSCDAAMEAEFAQLPLICLRPGRNLGFGGGLALAMQTALTREGDRLTHFLILDDDAELPPDSLPPLLARMDAVRAEVGCPIIVGPDGRIGWFPGLRSPAAFHAIRTAATPVDYLRACGEQSVPFTWGTFVCLLVSARAVRAVGLPRDDFWVRGEDLEYTLRLTSRFASAFVPGITVRHMIPSRVDTPAAARGERVKYLSMLQNCAYTGLWLPHGRRLLRHLPGNIYRFLRLPGFLWSDLGLVMRALWNGFVKAKPSGATGADTFYRAMQAAKG